MHIVILILLSPFLAQAGIKELASLRIINLKQSTNNVASSLVTKWFGRFVRQPLNVPSHHNVLNDTIFSRPWHASLQHSPTGGPFGLVAPDIRTQSSSVLKVSQRVVNYTKPQPVATAPAAVHAERADAERIATERDPSATAENSPAGVDPFTPVVAKGANMFGFGYDRVALRNSPTGLRGVYAVRPFSAGEVVGTVPREICLVAERSEATSAPRATWASLKAGRIKNFRRLQAPITGFLPNVIRLAIALLDVADGDGGTFWEEYCKLLPCPAELAVPLMTPSDKIGDPALAQEMQSQREELRELVDVSPSLAEVDGSDGFDRRGLLWAAACVRSRSIGIGPNLLALCPFFDMINHAAEPNTEVVANEAFSAPLDGEGGGILYLVALRDVAVGEQITITYAPNVTQDELFMRYGFKVSETL